jgi:hypothetical protein
MMRSALLATSVLALSIGAAKAQTFPNLPVNSIVFPGGLSWNGAVVGGALSNGTLTISGGGGGGAITPPQPNALGGIYASSCAAHNVVAGAATTGSLSCLQLGEGDIINLATDLATISAGLTSANGTIATLNSVSGSHTGQITTLQNDVTSIDSTLSSLSTSVTSALGSLTTLSSTVLTQGNEIATLTTNLTTETTRAETAEGTLSAGIAANVTAIAGKVPLDTRSPPVVATAFQPQATVDQRGPTAADNTLMNYTPAYSGAGTLTAIQGSLWNDGKGHIYQDEYDGSSCGSVTCTINGADWLDITPTCLPGDCIGTTVTGLSAVSGGASFAVGDPVVGAVGGTHGTVSAIGTAGNVTGITLSSPAAYYAYTSAASTVVDTFHASTTQTNAISGSLSVGTGGVAATEALAYGFAGGVDLLYKGYFGPAINVSQIGQPASVNKDIPFSAGLHIDSLLLGQYCGQIGCRLNTIYNQFGTGENIICPSAVSAAAGLVYDERPYIGPLRLDHDGTPLITFDGSSGTGIYNNPALTSCNLGTITTYTTNFMSVAMVYGSMTNALAQFPLHMNQNDAGTKYVEITNAASASPDEWSVSFGSDSGRFVLPVSNQATDNILVASNSGTGTLGLNTYINDYSNASPGASTHTVNGGYIGYNSISGTTGLPGSGIGAMDLRDIALVPRPLNMGQGSEGQTFEASLTRAIGGVPQRRNSVCKLEDSEGGAGSTYHNDVSSYWQRQTGRNDIAAVPSWWYGLPDAFLVNLVYPQFCQPYLQKASGPWPNKIVVIQPSRHDFTTTTESGQQTGTTLTITATACNFCLAPGYTLTTPIGTETIVSQVSSSSPTGLNGDTGIYTVSASQSFSNTTNNISSVATAAGVEQLLTAFAATVHAAGGKLEFETAPLSSGYAAGEVTVNAWMRTNAFTIGDGMFGDIAANPVFSQTSGWTLGPPNCFTQSDNVHFYSTCQAMEASMETWQVHAPQTNNAGVTVTAISQP